MKNSFNAPFLYRDENWLVLNKPTGLSTHAANAGDMGIAEWIELHLGIKTHIFSRLDKGTSGLLLLALNPKSSSRAEQVHKQNLSKKIYYFISDQKYHHKKWTCRKELDQSPCKTDFEQIEIGEKYVLYRATITRGKTHQIRRHAEICNIPILGDDEHGGSDFPRLCLFCSEVIWPDIHQKLSLELPDSFRLLLKNKSRIEIETAVACEKRLNLLSSVTNAFRVVHRGEIMGLPFAIDIYSHWLCVTSFEEKISSLELQKKITPVIDYISKLYQCTGGIIKTNRQNPHSKKLFSDCISWGEPAPETFLVHEHELSYEINLNATQHTGLFLDQRDSRRRLFFMAQNKRVANLFSFTCSFSAVALKGNAEVVFSIDLAGGCLEKGKNNLAHNQLETLNKGKFIKEDVRTWLARQLRQKKSTPDTFVPWDIIICDPPVFASTGRGHSFSVSKMWPELAKNIREILAPNGVALFANNHRKGSDLFYLEELKKYFSDVTQMRPPLDFPQSKKAPTDVRIFWCTV